MENLKLKNRLITAYQNMNITIYEDDSKWSVEELAGYFLYNCTIDELKEEFKNVQDECEVRRKAWILIKKVIYPFTYLRR